MAGLIHRKFNSEGSSRQEMVPLPLMISTEERRAHLNRTVTTCAHGGGCPRAVERSARHGPGIRRRLAHLHDPDPKGNQPFVFMGLSHPDQMNPVAGGHSQSNNESRMLET